jgi:hypothetical protein
MACPVYLNNEVPWGQDMIGLSADKSLVYLFDSPTIIEQWTFPGNVQLSDIDAEVAMDDVGALGGGNGRACTLATNGKFYIADSTRTRPEPGSSSSRLTSTARTVR